MRSLLTFPLQVARVEGVWKTSARARIPLHVHARDTLRVIVRCNVLYDCVSRIHSISWNARGARRDLDREIVMQVTIRDS